METVERTARRARLARVLAFCVSAPLVGFGAAGCRVNENDVHRWESTVQGPDKLRAVLLHDKYDNPLRVEAALSLVRMKPRQGRRIGIGIMVEALASLTADTRHAIVALLVPAIIAELKKPPPVAPSGQPAPPDPSFPYKDASYAMLTYELTSIVADEGLKQSLREALVDWAMADFERRLDNRSQAYGMEQLLRHIGSSSVVGIPKLMTRDARRLDQMSLLVAELGDEKTKAEGSLALVEVAKFVVSDEWKKIKKPELEAGNAAAKLTPNEKQFQEQLQQYQDEELFRVLGAMKKVGGRPTIDWNLAFAADKNQSDKRRQASLAAIEGRLDRNNPDDIKRILAIASSDAPDIVLDQAFRRIGEMPRETVVDKLYDLFKTDKWKVRRVAAGTVLRMSTVKNIAEFMKKLPDGDAKGFAMGEALAYGAGLGDLKEGDPAEAVRKFLSTGSAAARATAVGYYFTHGTKDDLPTLKPLEDDSNRVPVCETDPDCKWICEVPKEGAKDPAQERESKDIHTIGEFVRFCVEPAMKERTPAPSKGAKP